jgi:mRNA-degrading endonuclease toxin of MazEF toxin-antitoxin module
MIVRADVVIARFPFVGGIGFKVRPAVVVQCDALNRKLENTILAMITGNIKLIGKEPTQFLIDPQQIDGATSGLTHASAVKGENLATVPQGDIVKTVGHLSDALVKELEDCLRVALGLS